MQCSCQASKGGRLQKVEKCFYKEKSDSERGSMENIKALSSEVILTWNY